MEGESDISDIILGMSLMSLRAEIVARRKPDAEKSTREIKDLSPPATFEALAIPGRQNLLHSKPHGVNLPPVGVASTFRLSH